MYPGSLYPTCSLSLARNTCAQQLPRAKELFETPYPVWELFQMKSVTLLCIKTIFFFFFLVRKKIKKESSKESGFREAVHMQVSPCPATHTPWCWPSPLPVALVGCRTAVRPLSEGKEESGQLYAVLAPSPSSLLCQFFLLFFIHSINVCREPLWVFLC